MENKYLKDIREKNGITLTQLSEKTGITAATLCLIENGKVEPRPATIKKLSDFYKIDYIEFYEKVEKGE